MEIQEQLASPKKNDKNYQEIDIKNKNILMKKIVRHTT